MLVRVKFEQALAGVRDERRGSTLIGWCLRTRFAFLVVKRPSVVFSLQLWKLFVMRRQLSVFLGFNDDERNII